MSRCGWVAERFKAPVLKTGEVARLPWVRIPPHPPCFSCLSVNPGPPTETFKSSRARAAFHGRYAHLPHRRQNRQSNAEVESRDTITEIGPALLLTAEMAEHTSVMIPHWQVRDAGNASANRPPADQCRGPAVKGRRKPQPKTAGLIGAAG